MNIFKRNNLKRLLVAIIWIALATGSIVLLAAGVRTKSMKHCRGLEVNIKGVSNNFFIDKADVKKIITSYVGDNITGIKITGFNLVAMEAELKKEVWIKNVELYFDNNEILQASIEEREPVARVFTAGGNTFYIDNTNMILPLSEKLSARLPVFTGFPSEDRILLKADSNLLNDVQKLSIRIQQDSFLMAMIDQVNITPQRNFEMIPKIGDQLIVFGNASYPDQKFSKLKLFYKKIMMKYGWNRYSIINLQYKGQVVGKLKGRDDVSADSVRTVEIMHEIALNTALAASDSLQTMIQDNEKNSTDISIIQQSMERDEPDESITPFIKFPVDDKTNALSAKHEKAVLKPGTRSIKKPGIALNKPSGKPVGKPGAKAVKLQPGNPPEKPKALMQNKNDY